MSSASTVSGEAASGEGSPSSSSSGGDRPSGDGASSDGRGRTLRRGDTIGRYVVLERLGAGGMGIVYAAFDPELDRKIALKLLRPGRRRSTQVARARLRREAQALARLSHPCVVAVHDVGTFEDQLFIAMEFVDGTDLGQWLAEQPRSWQEVLDAMRQAGEGLAAAHEAGVVHRDFKPENVLVARDGRVRVVDFGLATTASDEDDAASQSARRIASASRSEALDGSATSIGPAGLGGDAASLSDPPERSKLTRVGTIMGTPSYMAPEQHRGEQIDARSDQFSFCVALHEALYGERPFAGTSLAELVMNVQEGNVREPPRDAPAVPWFVRRTILRGLAVDPVERWPDMKSLLDQLAFDPEARRRRNLIGFGLGAAAVGAFGLFFWIEASAQPPCQGAERKLAGVWDETQRRAVAVAFSKTTLPYADDALSWTSARLDAYTARWVAIHTEACEATAIRKEQSQELLDRQMACLERRRAEVQELTRLLSQADADIVREAVGAASRLPPLDPCTDREALMADSTPLEGETAQRVAQIEDTLARGRQLFNLARYDEGLQSAREALESARALDYGPSRARGLLLMGQLSHALGDVSAAEEFLREAVWTSDDAGEDLIRAEAWKDLLWVLGVEQSRYDEARRCRSHALHALQRGGGDPLLESYLWHHLGVLARLENDTEAAIEHQRRALALRREHLPPEDPRLADSLLNLAVASTDAGRLDQAEDALAEAQNLIVGAYGNKHPRFAAALHARGVLAYRRGALDAAISLLESAVQVRAEALPDGHPDRASSRHDLGVVLLEAGRTEQALEQLELALAARTQTAEGEDSLATANTLTDLGEALLALGQGARAVEVLERAVGILDRREGPPSNRAQASFALARALELQNSKPNDEPNRKPNRKPNHKPDRSIAQRSLDLAKAALAAKREMGAKTADLEPIERWIESRSRRLRDAP